MQMFTMKNANEPLTIEALQNQELLLKEQIKTAENRYMMAVSEDAEYRLECINNDTSAPLSDDTLNKLIKARDELTAFKKALAENLEQQDALAKEVSPLPELSTAAIRQG